VRLHRLQQFRGEQHEQADEENDDEAQHAGFDAKD
jgi:hypothetical protein